MSSPQVRHDLGLEPLALKRLMKRRRRKGVNWLGNLSCVIVSVAGEIGLKQ